MSPTELPQPVVAPAGCYTRFFPGRYATQAAYQPGYLNLMTNNTYAYLHNEAFSVQYVNSPAAATESPHPDIEDLLKGIWRPPRPADPVAGVLGDRLDTQALGLGEVLSQIKERLTIYHNHFHELEQAKLDTKNVRHRWTDPLQRHGELADPDLVSALQEIDAQQRQERLSCWKDLAALRQLVPEQWRQYLSALRQDQWNNWGEGR